jgi:deoxyribodipyrimidine photo-lyase
VIQLVWLKRDLRVSDHAPLFHAMKAGPTVALYVFEPSQCALPDYAPMHADFVLSALRVLRASLSVLNVPLLVCVGEVVSTLDRLFDALRFGSIYSHEETGNLASYARDRAVKRWACEKQIVWHEFWQNGVQRPHPKRDGWARTWEARMARPLIAIPKQQSLFMLPEGLMREPPTLADLGFGDCSARSELEPGEHAGHAMLQSFLSTRGRTFRTAVSSPSEAWTAGSRLSPYLAYGCISLRQVVQQTAVRLESVLAEGDDPFEQSLVSFRSRLAWHCHFMQKLEDEPALEEGHAHPAMRNLRNEGELSFEEDRRLRAWKLGKTGYPIVDAVMRCLLKTGWINFRMRAMLVSYASYDLWLHWRPLALHLARNFIDYEPGIHYPQVQMQAGTTGTNALRMYDPAKQQRDHDLDGSFIKQWVPELAALPAQMLAEPFKMSRDQQRRFGVWIGKDYPAPMVPHAQAIRYAKSRFEALRLGPVFKQQAQAVFERHGSRRKLRGP